MGNKSQLRLSSPRKKRRKIMLEYLKRRKLNENRVDNSESVFPLNNDDSGVTYGTAVKNKKESCNSVVSTEDQEEETNAFNFDRKVEIKVKPYPRAKRRKRGKCQNLNNWNAKRQAQKLAQAGEEGASSSTSVSGLPTCSTNNDTNLAQPAKRLKFGAKDTEEREVQSSIATELEDNLSVHIKDEPIEEHDESLAALPSNVNWSTDHFMVSEDEIPTRPFRFPTPETRLCRLCSANEGVEYIFEQKEHYLASKIMAISSIKLWKGDGLSEFICADCDILLEKFYDFRIHCEATDVTLRAEFLQTQKNQAPLPAVTETKLSKLNKRLENALSTFYNVMDKILRENQTSKHPGQNSCMYWNPRTQKKRLRREVVRAGSPLDRSEESTSPRAERCSNSNTTNTETGISSDYVNNEFIGTFKSASEILIKSEILSSSHDEDSENMTNILINNLPSDISSENTPGYSSLSENSMSVSIVKQEETLDYQPLESNQLDYSLQVKTEDQFDDEYCHDVEPKVDIHTLSPSEIDGSRTLVATESDIEITNKVEKL